MLLKTLPGKAVLTVMSGSATFVTGRAYFDNLWNWDEGVAERGFFAHLTETAVLGYATGQGLASTFTLAQGLARDIHGRLRRNVRHTGGSSGTNPHIEDPNLFLELEEKAEMFYDEVRRNSGDVELIARNTGRSVEEISQIRDHLFINEHQLDNNTRGRFDADIWIAEAWERLRNNTFNDLDDLLLSHELIELRHMNQTGSTYREAHEVANSIANWWQAVLDSVPRR